jgi:ribosomal protein S19E (S16A)
MLDVNADNIFGCCRQLLEKIEKNLFLYKTDGLIFTPIKNGVGADKPGKSSKLKKTVWDYSFKWKPPEFNTIDFLVTTKKSENGEDHIGNLFVEGNDLTNENKIRQYKTLELRCGFNLKEHGYVNPVNDMIEDNIIKSGEIDNNDIYKPALFYPSDPSDDEAHICELFLINDDAGNKQMVTEEGETFTDNTIVEFKYDMSKPKRNRWIPIKVRYDKTVDYKKGGKNYGNAYHVANSNWYSIHNPITEEMLKTGENIPENTQDDDVYYNRISNINNTQALRDFHNIVVKKKLITSVSNRGDTLIDYAVGMGGDFPKWIQAKLSFVFGIDISKDNIENKLRGACARYLNYRKDYSSMPSALFVHGNSGLNIKSGDAVKSEKDKMITKAVFGEGTKSESKLGKGVYKQYGKGVEGFNISSCQFALHYFFENVDMLTNFMRNICECTKINGYFIGACYDGKLIFEKLKNKKKGEGITLMNKSNTHKIWQITKQYDNEKMKDDSTSINIGIDIYQETINKTFREYLVNFDYLIRIMENYGFVPLDDADAKKMGLPSGIGNLKEIYSVLEEDFEKNNKIKKDIKQSLNMSDQEKYISFLNKYFIFKKIRNIDAKSVKIDLVDEEETEDVENKTKKKSDKKGKKLRLVE